MRYGWIGLAVLPLSACGQAADRAQTPAAGETVTAASSAPVARPFDPAHPGIAMLDELVSPRQPGRYAPRDECGSLPGARDFRLKLAWAVKDRNSEAVAALASPDIRLGFGGDDGRARFLAKLKAPDGALFAELEKILSLGCAATDGGGLTAPWFFAQDYGDIDGSSAMLVMGSDVPLLQSAKATAPEVQRISWDLVELVGGLYPERPFQQVRTPAGATGYVATDRLRSLLDYRLLAVRQGEVWTITAFLAGD